MTSGSRDSERICTCGRAPDPGVCPCSEGRYVSGGHCRCCHMDPPPPVHLSVPTEPVAPPPAEGETERPPTVDDVRRIAAGLLMWCDDRESPIIVGHYAAKLTALCKAWAARDPWQQPTLPTSPAVGAEVRVEWGVRDAIGYVGHERTTRQSAESFVLDSSDALMRRTITTYPDGSFLTEAWVPVTDDQEMTDAAH